MHVLDRLLFRISISEKGVAASWGSPGFAHGPFAIALQALGIVGACCKDPHHETSE